MKAKSLVADNSEVFAFSFLAGGSKDLIRPASVEESVRQSILTILSTECGERPLYPEFGCELRKFIFRRNDKQLQSQIIDEVKQSIRRSERRIEIEDVKIRSEQHQLNTLEIKISYRILATGDRQSIVYPMQILD